MFRDLYSKTHIMGILNLTPDSFSKDGIYKDVGLAVEKAESLVEDGADIIDIGGESTRPGSEKVFLEEEIERVMPVINKLAKKINVPISIDTSKPEVARLSLDNGASIVNDISGFTFDDRMCDIVASYGAKVIIMHIKGDPKTMQAAPSYDGDVVDEILERLGFLVGSAMQKGVKRENIIIDPGIGFGKTLEHNLEILNNLSRLKALKLPILIGPSRKSFIGSIIGAETGERVFGTAAACAIAINNGANIIRVHDVFEIAQVAKVTDAIIRSREGVNVR